MFKIQSILITFCLLMVFFYSDGVSLEYAEITPWRGGKKSAICLGFDDGGGLLADTILTNRGFYCYYAINSGWQNIKDHWDVWNDIARKGHEISSHGKNHLSPTSPEYLNDIRDGIIEIEKNIKNYKVLTHLNAGSKGTIDAYKEMHKLGLISSDQGGRYIGYGGFTYDLLVRNDSLQPSPFFGINRTGCDYKSLEAIKKIVFTEAINNGSMTNLFWHDIGGQINLEDFRSFANWLKTMQDSGLVWVAKYQEIVKYMAGRINTEVLEVEKNDWRLVLTLKMLTIDTTYRLPLTVEVKLPLTWQDSGIVLKKHLQEKVVKPQGVLGKKFLFIDLVPGIDTISIFPLKRTSINHSKSQFGNEKVENKLHKWYSLLGKEINIQTYRSFSGRYACQLDLVSKQMLFQNTSRTNCVAGLYLQKNTIVNVR